MAFSIERESSSDIHVVLGLDFQSEDAWRIHQLVDGTRPDSRLQIDFRRVRDCQDFALSLLARDLLSGHATIELLGMSQHQERVLSYFGVPTGSRSAIADFDSL